MTRIYLQPQPRRHNTFPTVVKGLLIANVLMFLLQSQFAGQMQYWLALWPLGENPVPVRGGYFMVNFWPWQLITYGFLHGNFTHLFFNMYALWMFGAQVENQWGSRAFAVFYLVCVIGAAIMQLTVLKIEGGRVAVATIGASGGVFGVLLAYGMMFPNRMVMLLIPPIPMKAKYLVMIFGGLELVFGVSGAQSGVAHFAHLGGMLFGFLLIQYWRGRVPFKRR
jgi:membrane associated rhomboid family serine protease